MAKSCNGLAMELDKCLSETDCVKEHDEGEQSDGSLDDDNAIDLNEAEEDKSDGVNDDDKEEKDEELEEQVKEESKSHKRKFIDYGGELNAADAALNKLAESKNIGNKLSYFTDGILSNEDFKRIKELKAKKDAKLALRKGAEAKSHRFKIPTYEELSLKRVDPAKLEINIRRKQNKEERLASVSAGREDRGDYQARAAVKHKKTGGLTNVEKEHKKPMPIGAKRAKVVRKRREKKIQRQRAGKNFRGKKAWK